MSLAEEKRAAMVKIRQPSKRILSDHEKELLASIAQLGEAFKACVGSFGSHKTLTRAQKKMDEAVAVVVGYINPEDS